MSKNTHMEHIEEMIFNDGVDGARLAINSLRNLRDMLAGKTGSRINATVKWDGAPAVFAGVDPEDGKFFVAKKGLFNKEPKMYKTQADINRELSGELKTKFTIALRELSKLGIKSGVYQGDLLFTPGDVKVETIDGERMYTFHPNTIVYTVPVKSSLGAQIARAKMGIIWHTTYEGSTIQGMKASFGRNIVSKMNKVPSVFMDDATYKDVSGTATFTNKETAEVTRLISNAGKQLNRISGDVLRMIRDDEELKAKIKQFNNQYVRRGEPFPDARRHVKELYEFIEGWYQKEIDKKKTQKSKKDWEGRRDLVLKKVFSNVTDLTNIFELMNIIVMAKQKIIDKMNRAGSIGTMLKTTSGFKVTSPEGFVAIDHDGNAIKLVDRLEFSRANFSPDVLKGWQK